MVKDVPGIRREVYGYSKIPDEDGEQLLEVRYALRPINLSYLQEIFDVDPNDPNDAVVDVIGECDINSEQAAALQPYVIDGVIDLDKYDFQFGCVADPNVK